MDRLFCHVHLSPLAILSGPGPLPGPLVGDASDAVLADLAWTDPSYGLRGTGFWPVVRKPPAGFNALFNRLVDEPPTLNPDLRVAEVVQTLQALPPEESAALEREQMKAVGDKVQAHLDAVAQLRDYDSGHTIATYLESKVPRYAATARTFVDWRDSCWDRCDQLKAEVKAGRRPPLTPEETVAELPAPPWTEPVL